ncbi:hypothetical protein FDP25_15720 [Roseovarius sp. A21]|uniref:Lipoprotein n=1 Tax=Roseovarius bejariae TaxID=2576383 RepID=A0A844D265_9RHOB|nr:DUF6778 family protein [Roseovarius bejariae]MRU16890.1 hypothetical protein [Roseovarius bejariae]
MKHIRMIAAMMLGLAVSACGSVETATRNAPLDAPELAPSPVSFNVQAVRVSVPETLKVSEANRYYPGGDIVWREDPVGDRHAQVKAIVQAGITKGVNAMEPGTVPVIMDVEVTRFHALTEKARYTIGGVHAIQFKMQLRNPETGQAYGKPHFVKADFKAFGGTRAIEAEREGITQKYRITEHLAKVIETELTSPEGYKAAHNGIIGAINQL